MINHYNYCLLSKCHDVSIAFPAITNIQNEEKHTALHTFTQTIVSFVAFSNSIIVVTLPALSLVNCETCSLYASI